MENKIIFALIPLFVIITVFSLSIQESFGETRVECRSLINADKSLTPVERIYAIKTCDPLKNNSDFQKYYTEELHNECTRILKENTPLNHVARLNDLKECNKLQKYDSTSSQKITKFSRTTIETCDEKYQIYLLVGAKKMWNHAGGLTPQCLKLYSAPMWNSTADDRQIQLHNFISDEIKQSVEEAKNLRQQGIEDAQLRNPVFFNLKYLFDEQKGKIEDLENQLRERNIILDYSEQDFFNEKYRDCLKIVYDETFEGIDKMYALDDCSKNKIDISNSIIQKEILESSKSLVQLCNNSYGKFLELSLEGYYGYMKNLQSLECVALFENPIWEDNQNDRIDVIEKFVYDKTLNYYKDYLERTNAITQAELTEGMVPILSDLYKYQKQKIELLEDILKTEKIE